MVNKETVVSVATSSVIHRSSPLWALRLCRFAFFAGILISIESAWADPEKNSGSTHPKLPAVLEADRVQSADNVVQADGNVHIEYGEWTAEGQSLRYDLSSGRLQSTQPASLKRPALLLESKCLDVNLNNHVGSVDSPSLTIPATDDQHPARYFSAERLTLQDSNHATLYKARYTGCPSQQPDWWLNSQRIDLDQARGIGEAHNATLFFKGVPLFYTPWLDFSLTGQRKSGLLPPTFGSSTERGFEFQLPVYLNLAPNYDATLTPRWMSKRGLQLNSQFRYLTDTQRGELNGEWLPNDQIAAINRSFLSWKHTSTLSDWNGTSRLRLNLNRVSDSNYFADLSERVSATSQGTLPREIDWAKTLTGPLNTSALARLRIQRFQALQTLPADMPYERVPQFNLTTNTPLTQLWPGLSLYSQTEAARFSQATLPSVDRAVVYPQLRYIKHTPSSLLEGHLGLNGRLYRENGQFNQIWTPISSLDGHLYFEPDTPNDYHPMLETRAYYVYIPYREQSAIRMIDSAPFASDDLGLFSENDFTGSDRINDANRLTLAFNTHWKHANRDTERLMLGVAQRYSFQTPQISPGDIKTRNPLFVYGRGEMGPGFNWTAGASYDLDKHLTQQIQFGVQYRPNDNALLNVIYRFQRDAPLTPQPDENWRQIDISGQWVFSPKWKSVWRWNYDIENHKMLESLGGLEYTYGCWGIRAVGQHLVTSSTTSSRAFFIQLELESLGQIGSNPIDVLRRSIPGYVDPHAAATMPFMAR